MNWRNMFNHRKNVLHWPVQGSKDSIQCPNFRPEISQEPGGLKRQRYDQRR